MLNINNLVKSFDNIVAVDHISFTAVRGQILGFLGPNGAGKTTTMRMITGALIPNAGSVFVCDVNMLTNPTLAKKFLGYLPEGAPLYTDMTPREYLNFIADVKDIKGNHFKSHFEDIIENIMITDVLDNPINYLSKGYKRRVALAGALLGDPQILILDEPTDGLDPNQKYHIRNLLKRLSENKTIIISTHILEEVEAICTDAIIINKGRIIASATPKELMAMSPTFNAVVMVIQTSVADKCIAQIEALSYIQEVIVTKKMSNWTKIVIYPQKKRYILGEISDIIHKQEYHVAEIRCDTGKLDDVFRELTY